MKTLGDHIRKRQLDLGLLQKEVAEKLGVDTASIVNWESNEVQPMVHCLPGIIAFLEHNLLPEADDLIGKFKRVLCTLGLTQEQLAQKKLGIDESTICWLGTGRELTPVGSYLKLVPALVARDGSRTDFAGSAPAEKAFSARKITALRKKAWVDQSGATPGGSESM